MLVEQQSGRIISFPTHAFLKRGFAHSPSSACFARSKLKQTSFVLKNRTLALRDSHKLNQVSMLQIGHRHLIWQEVEIVWGLRGVLHCVVVVGAVGVLRERGGEYLHG